MNFLREYFIGDYLRSESDVLRQASIRLVFAILALAIASLGIFFSIYLAMGYHHQLIKSAVIAGLFIGALFYIREKKSLDVVCHVLILISWANNNLNIYLFDSYNFFIALLTVCNILFAFHLLGSRCGIFYSVLHILPIIAHFVLKHAGVTLRSGPPQQMAFIEIMATLVVVFFIITYLIYHYHKSFALAKAQVRQSVEEMKKAKEMAEEINRLRSNFISSMSHEIRTPINGILGLSQVIEREAPNEDLKKYSRMQYQSGRRLLNTVNSILSLSRLEAQRSDIRLRAVDITALINTCARSFDEQVKAKGLTLDVEPHNQFTCQTDEVMVSYALTCIIDNAVKFTNKGGIVISLQRDDTRENFFVICVQDTGIGITAEFLPRVFNAFEQESSGRNRNYEGAGLGLSISKRYIELLDGEIRVKSVKEQGTTFEIILPLHEESIVR